MILSLHIGAGFEVIRRPAEAPIDHLMVLACQISAITAQDLLFGPTLRQFPDLKVALSEGGIGWMPYLLERIDYSWGRHKYWCDINADKVPSELFREHIYGCFISDQSGIEQRHRIGVDNIMFESDYPHSDSNWPHTRKLLAEHLIDVPDDEARKMVELNARTLYDFWA
jgi:predicted TIM-barrel fold metal-dependent hydrolase